MADLEVGGLQQASSIAKDVWKNAGFTPKVRAARAARKGRPK
jgi:hypothetical protein